jgi:hypothetical protein
MKTIITLITLISMSSIAHAGRASIAEEAIAVSASKIATKTIARDFKEAFISTRQEAKQQAKQYASADRNNIPRSGNFEITQIISEGSLPDNSNYRLLVTSGVNSDKVVSTSFRLVTDTENKETLIALSNGISGRGTGLHTVVEKDNNGYVEFRGGTGVGLGYTSEGKVLTADINQEDLDLVTRKLIKLQSDIQNKTLGKKIQLSRKASRAAAAK